MCVHTNDSKRLAKWIAQSLIDKWLIDWLSTAVARLFSVVYFTSYLAVFHDNYAICGTLHIIYQYISIVCVYIHYVNYIKFMNEDLTNKNLSI